MYDDQHIKLCQAIDKLAELKNTLQDKSVQIIDVIKPITQAIDLINSAIDKDESGLDKETLEKFQKEMAGYKGDN